MFPGNHSENKDDGAALLSLICDFKDFPGIIIPTAGKGNREGTHRKNVWLCLEVTSSISVLIYWLKFRHMTKSKGKVGWEI